MKSSNATLEAVVQALTQGGNATATRGGGPKK